jgi:chromosome segregation ATPase
MTFQVKKVKLDKQVLERYLTLENETRALESKNVLKNYRVKQDQLKDFEETIKVYDVRYKECIKQT